MKHAGILCVSFQTIAERFRAFFWVQFRGLWDVCYLVNLALVFLVLLPLYFFFFFFFFGCTRSSNGKTIFVSNMDLLLWCTNS